MNRLFLTLIVLILSSGSVQAEQSRRGLVTSGLCPLSCEDLAVPSSSCKEWTVGQKCFVEDMRSPAGHRSVAIVPGKVRGVTLPKMGIENPQKRVESSDDVVSMNSGSAGSGSMNSDRRGLVTTSSCPYSCADAGVPKADCRSYQTGTSCSVEDLRQGPGHRSMLRVSQ